MMFLKSLLRYEFRGSWHLMMTSCFFVVERRWRSCQNRRATQHLDGRLGGDGLVVTWSHPALVFSVIQSKSWTTTKGTTYLLPPPLPCPHPCMISPWSAIPVMRPRKHAEDPILWPPRLPSKDGGIPSHRNELHLRLHSTPETYLIMECPKP